MQPLNPTKGDNDEKVYNLANDLGEKNDLAAQNPAKARELQTKLTSWRKEVGAIIPKPVKK